MEQRMYVVKALILLTIFVQVLQGQIQGPLDKSGGLCATFVFPKHLGYTCEEYSVQTSDGFRLGVQRMYSGPQLGTSTGKKPVFLYHGILTVSLNLSCGLDVAYSWRVETLNTDQAMCGAILLLNESGDSWLLNEPSNSLPFMLGHAGYEVWIGNSRTGNYSDGHVSMSKTDAKYWDWSLDELAKIDVPAMLSVVLSMNSASIHYVGYSQGSQAAIAAFALGEALPKLDHVVFMAPVAYSSSIKTVLVLGADLFIIDEMMLLGIYDFDPHLDSTMAFMDRLCSYPDANCTDNGINDDLVAAVTGPNCCVNSSMTSYYNKFFDSTATKNIVHLAQQYRTQSFAKYDYGLLQNWQVYNSLFPPAYDMGAIPSMPMLLIHGGNDGLADENDVDHFIQQLKFQPQVILLPDYGHMDFMIGETANADVYSKVLAFLTT